MAKALMEPQRELELGKEKMTFRAAHLISHGLSILGLQIALFWEELKTSSQS